MLICFIFPMTKGSSKITKIVVSRNSNKLALLTSACFDFLAHWISAHHWSLQIICLELAFQSLEDRRRLAISPSPLSCTQWPLSLLPSFALWFVLFFFFSRSMWLGTSGALPVNSGVSGFQCLSPKAANSIYLESC